MRLINLHKGNLKSKLPQKIKESIQILPLWKSHQEGFQDFLKVISDDNIETVVLEKKSKDFAYLSYSVKEKKLSVKGYLAANGFLLEQYGQSFWFDLLEFAGKREAANTIAIKIPVVSFALVEQLEKAGYEQTVIDAQGSLYFTKELSYRTGLVLAGGGARGAYQIGAWRALKELGINFDIITGTSVGALNGGLILQGDYSVAKTMWEKIDTGKIVSFPTGTSSATTYSPNKLLKEMQNFAVSAISSQGVSTAPLLKLINDLLDEEKMYKSSKDFYFCTTQLPSLKETVICLKETKPDEINRWLLASSSFFPAMEVTEIEGQYYVDGGYRNNIPVDVAINNGATELIVVDVKGPGLTKPYRIPETIPVVTVVSPWELGAVLLFDGARSHWNIELGYLETLKAFGKMIGHWYTFAHQWTDSEITDWKRSFSQFLKEDFSPEERKILQENNHINELIEKTRSLYCNRVPADNLSVYILELVAKTSSVNPTKQYTIEELTKEIRKNMATSGVMVSLEEEEMLLSLQEWVKRYLDHLPLTSEKQQILFIYHHLRKSPNDKLLNIVALVAPAVYLAAKLMSWIEKNDEKEGSHGPRI